MKLHQKYEHPNKVSQTNVRTNEPFTLPTSVASVEQYVAELETFVHSSLEQARQDFCSKVVHVKMTAVVVLKPTTVSLPHHELPEFSWSAVTCSNSCQEDVNKILTELLQGIKVFLAEKDAMGFGGLHQICLALKPYPFRSCRFYTSKRR